ncbi:hypothetical protein Q8A67_024173 [Cirrhinus molitorella]|uniref:Uncharacterized protein n=1 Tax=Cirrhinus molitorella TaxID=172907 RepID=A0AA88NY28_9TELE|nr:hypothetical protein Q8A67_024173 [Cirrhinus molitorella]
MEKANLTKENGVTCTDRTSGNDKSKLTCPPRTAEEGKPQRTVIEKCFRLDCSPQCEGLEKMDTSLNHRAVARQRLQEHRLIINKPSCPPGPDQSLHLQNPGGFGKHLT